MKASPVDPRDVGWEKRDPAYRVYFWSALEGSRSAPLSDEWRVTDAVDVHEVIAWAESEREGRTYELFIEHVDRKESRAGWTDALGLIRLAGTNPSDGTSVEVVFHSV